MHDVIVAGLGGMGSAVAAHCARTGADVIGLDRYDRGHDLGSSQGKTRLFRKAYFEDARYVPLLCRAEEGWRTLEKEAGRSILHQTGLLLVGRAESEIIRGSFASATQHALAVERLTANEMRRRFPAALFENDEVGLFEIDAGVLEPEFAIEAQLTSAEQHGAELRFTASMHGWRVERDRAIVTLADGEEVEARALVLTLGPWSRSIFASAGVPLQLQRNIQAWFRPKNSSFVAGEFPPFLVDRPHFRAALYGFPDFGDGVKAALHGDGDLVDPETMLRTIEREKDVRPIEEAMDRWLPDATGEFLGAKACLYSLTPDQHFVIDRHPAHSNVILCGGFSGHGFKFAPVIGEIAGDLALRNYSPHDIGFLSLARFRP